MSAQAMPAAPKLACSSVSPGAAPWARTTAGAARVAAASRARAARRVGGRVIGWELVRGGTATGGDDTPPPGHPPPAAGHGNLRLRKYDIVTRAAGPAAGHFSGSYRRGGCDAKGAASG